MAKFERVTFDIEPMQQRDIYYNHSHNRSTWVLLPRIEDSIKDQVGIRMHRESDSQIGHGDVESTVSSACASTLQIPTSSEEQKQHNDSVCEEAKLCEPEEPSPPPDGGLCAWMQVLSSFLVFLCTGYMLAFGIFEPYYEHQLHIPNNVIAWTGSLQISMVLFMGAFSGRAFDAGYYRECLAIGATVQVFGIVGTSFATKPWELVLAQGICQGVGFGCVYGPAVAHAATYFSKKRTFAIAVVSTGTSAGGVLFPLMAQQLVPKLGFPWTIRVTALLVLVLAIASFCLTRKRLSSRKSGPLVELSAFRELKYSLFTASFFFSLLAYYFAYSYVS